VNQKKILILLILFVILVNYINYFQKDRKKLFNQINMIEKKIEREERLNHMDINLTSLKTEQFKYLFDKKSSYSKSMGDMQEIINTSAKGICEVEHLKWSQVPISKEWYQYLKFDISLVCNPSDMIHFANKLKESKKLIIFRDVRISKIHNKHTFRLRANLIGFKVKNDK